MILDFNQWPDGQVIEADLCIAGAGAAGLTLAREFLGSSTRVVVLESGGEIYDHATQSLYEMVNVGLPRGPEMVARVRQFGGSTNLWAGRCAPLSKLDFSQRDWVPHSGWPIQREDLDPYYERANAVLGLGPVLYDEGLYQAMGHDVPEAFSTDKLRQQFWQFSRGAQNNGQPIRFGADYRETFDKADNIQLFLHANLKEIVTDESGQRVTGLRVASLNGKSADVKAGRVVLACGGIENARLLLASRSVNPAGVGNDHDQVGRYFMEHPRGTSGLVVAGNTEALQELCRHHWLETDSGRQVYLSGIAAADAYQRRKQILNCDVSVVEYEDPESGTRAMERLLKSESGDYGDDIWRVMGDLADVAQNSYRRLVDKKPPIIDAEKIQFECHIEQAPNPLSRITLADDVDALGMLKGKMDWRLGEMEQKTIESFMTTLAAELARLNLGRVKIADWVLDRSSNWTQGVQDVAHHMGSTRMSSSPGTGVVDANARVHGVENLFVAGSSVFSTAGCVNPTYTLVAQSIRLADHLKKTNSGA